MCNDYLHLVMQVEAKKNTSKMIIEWCQILKCQLPMLQELYGLVFKSENYSKKAYGVHCLKLQTL